MKGEITPLKDKEYLGVDPTSDEDIRSFYFQQVIDSLSSIEPQTLHRYRAWELALQESTELVFAKFEEFCKSHNLSLIYKASGNSILEESYGNARGHLTIEVRTTKPARGSVTGNCLDEKIINEFKKFSEALFVFHPTSRLYFIGKTYDGFELKPLAETNYDVDMDNYSDSVKAAYKHVVDDLTNPKPCGRLVMLSGEPGVGKSYIIRHLVQNTKGLCVLVSHDIVAQLGNPDFVEMLFDNADPKKPLILIVEDADMFLLERSSDNIQAITSILNYCDGIFGELLNLRVVVTTNAKTLEIDKAIMRPGRLCRQIPIGLTEPGKAEEIFQRISGKSRTFDKPVSLAEIYRLALQPDETPVSKSGMGFK